VADWEFCQNDAEERLAKIRYFSMMKGDVEFTISVKEFVSPPDLMMKFFAEGDKELNQSTAAFRPTGWGGSMRDALAACLQTIRKFPYEG